MVPGRWNLLEFGHVVWWREALNSIFGDRNVRMSSALTRFGHTLFSPNRLFSTFLRY